MSIPPCLISNSSGYKRWFSLSKHPKKAVSLSDVVHGCATVQVAFVSRQFVVGWAFLICLSGCVIAFLWPCHVGVVLCASSVLRCRVVFVIVCSCRFNAIRRLSTLG